MEKYNEKPLKRVQEVALPYYSRKDIQEEIFNFCKNRETIANFNNEFFAKRPDCFDYSSDILNSVRQGATSFHCSEEIWENPLDINTDMTKEEYNGIKIGWDLLIDIDSKYLDYSKIAALLLIETLERHGIKNIGIKFSGSKGFHIIVPFKAFPKEFSNEITKDNFPEWPRLMARYLLETIKPSMLKEILKLTNKDELEERGELILEQLCPNCNRPTQKKIIGRFLCPDIKCRSEVDSMISNRKEMVCPSCNGNMNRILEIELYHCESCNINTNKLEKSASIYGGEKRDVREKFKEHVTTKSIEDSVDIVLVSPRHLFRAPYSLHEKTALASIVISKEKIKDFKPSDADPLKIKDVKSFMPNSREWEAKELLAQALDLGEKNKPETKKYKGTELNLKGLTFTEEMYPPIIKKILLGIKDDGRKRALSLMLSFFTSLEFPQDFIEEKIVGWNKKNYLPLKEGYVKSQITWHIKNKRLPPNYDKPIYKEFGINSPPEPGIKNPINYTIKKAMQAKGRGKN